MKAYSIKEKGQTAFSTLCWGIYMVLNGVIMIVSPNISLSLLGFEPTEEVYIRIGGILALALGYYYIQLGRYIFPLFYVWKIKAHVVGVAIMLSFYFTGLATAPILIFCFFDAAAAIWTAWGISRDKKRTYIPTAA